MLGKFRRRNNRKTRLANWFARERDSDLQVFNLHPFAVKLSRWLTAIPRASRPPAGGAEKGGPAVPD